MGKDNNMKIIIIILIILLLIIFVVGSIKIRVKITKYHHVHTNVDLYLTDIFKFHIDIDEKLKSYIKNKNIRKFLIDIKKGINFYLVQKELFSEILKKVKVKKITIVTQYENYDPVVDSYLKFSNWLFYSSVNRLLENKFEEVDNPFYQIISNKKRREVGYVLEMTSRVYKLVFLYFQNRNEFNQLLKERKN